MDEVEAGSGLGLGGLEDLAPGSNSGGNGGEGDNGDEGSHV